MGPIVKSSFCLIPFLKKLWQSQGKYRQVCRKQMCESGYKQEVLKIELETQNNNLIYLGRELHENLGQLIAVVKINLNILEDDPATPEPVKLCLNETNEIVSEAMSLIRGIAKELETDFLLKYGLMESLNTEMLRARQRGQFETEIVCQGNPYALSSDIDLVLLSIVQEFLNICIKSLKVARLKVVIVYLANQVRIVLRSESAEINFEEMGVTGFFCLGAQNIKRKMDLIGGSCSFKLEENAAMMLSLEVSANKKTWI